MAHDGFQGGCPEGGFGCYALYSTRATQTTASTRVEYNPQHSFEATRLKVSLTTQESIVSRSILLSG